MELPNLFEVPKLPEREQVAEVLGGIKVFTDPWLPPGVVVLQNERGEVVGVMHVTE